MATNRQIAAALGVTPGRVSQMFRAGMPRDIDKALQWRAANLRRKPRTASDTAQKDANPDVGVETHSWRDRLDRARALSAELQLQRVRGQQVRVGEVQSGRENENIRVRARLLQLASRAAPRIAPPGQVEAAVAILTELVCEALTELSGDSSDG